MNAGMSLPPSVRDFEIYAAIVTRQEATRKVADDHELSQTRVRQIATRVADWVAEHLPAKDEAVQAKELRLLQHVAADRLEHQYGELIENWRAKNDPKYLRQATRIALAQARLGVMPGRIEALAADAIEGPLEVEDLSLGRTKQCSVPRRTEQCAVPQQVVPQQPINPPAGDCSTNPQNASAAQPAAVRPAAVSASGDKRYLRELLSANSQPQSLEAIERALLSSSDLPFVTERRLTPAATGSAVASANG